MGENSPCEIIICMGSQSDWKVMQEASVILNEFGLSYSKQILSAHRTPEKMIEEAKAFHTKGLKVVIAGAGGAAHLPGMIASLTPLPVIGVPIHSSNSVLGVDSLLSIVQMPKGVPVACVAVDGATNAGILAASILGLSSPKLQSQILEYKESLKQKVLAQELPQ